MAIPTRILFINEDYVRKNTTLNSAVDAALIQQATRLGQDMYIQESLGTDLYVKMQTDTETLIGGGSITADYLTLLQTYLMPATLWWTMVKLYPSLYVKHNNGSLAHHISEDTQVIDNNTYLSLLDEARSNAKFYTTRLEEYLCENSSLYAEFSTNSGSDIRPGTSGYSKGVHRFGHSARGHYPYHNSIYRPT